MAFCQPLQHIYTVAGWARQGLAVHLKHNLLRGGVLSASVMASIQPHEELSGLCSDASVFLLKIRAANACNHVVYISRPLAHDDLPELASAVGVIEVGKAALAACSLVHGLWRPDLMEEGYIWP